MSEQELRECVRKILEQDEGEEASTLSWMDPETAEH